MPRLIALLPCEKILYGLDESVSLIMVLSEFHFVPRSPEAMKDLPPNAGVYFKWAVFVQWERDSRDNNEKSFQQSIGLASEAGVSHFTNVSTIEFQVGKTTYRNIGHFDAVPVVPEGKYDLVVRWRLNERTDWVEAGKYPIRVAYDPAPSPSVSVPMQH
ncbi:MAG: hypothetical protein ACRD3L_12120 [Terriglobales bacterium]